MRKNKDTFIILALILGIGFTWFVFIRNTELTNHEWLGKKIIFPKELQMIKGNIPYPIEVFNEESANKYKIVSIIDTSCSKCIMGQLNKIDSMFDVILSRDTTVVVVFLLNVDNSYFPTFLTTLRPMITGDAYILWDNDFNFETNNTLLTANLSHRTFLLNLENEIELVGSPLFFPNIIDDYKEKIRENP